MKEATKIILISATIIAIFIVASLNFNGNLFNISDNTKNDTFPRQLKIGFITDVHCYGKENKETKKWELNWRCEKPMKAFVKKMNTDFRPDFVIEGGDFIDGKDNRGLENFKDLKIMYSEINAPQFHVLGNHEASRFSKDEWLKITGYDKSYYHFDISGYRVIVLDANFRPSANDTIDADHENKYGPGFVNQEQILWLEKALNDSGKMRKIVFVHQPPLKKTTTKESGDLLNNGKVLRDLFSKYDVLAVFSGHIEEVCDLEIDGVRYFTFQGFYKKNSKLDAENHYKDGCVFNEITIKGEDIEIEMYYKEKKESSYESIIIKQDTAVCNNYSVLN